MKRNNLFKRCPGFHKVWLSPVRKSFSRGINLIFIFMILFIFTTGSEVLAHKVNIFAYVDKDMVFTESYFNDGRKCVDSKVEVFDSTGNKLLEGKTDKAGEFSFKAPGKTDLRLVLTASMGHRAEYTVPASELPESEPQPARQGTTAGIIKQRGTTAVEVVHVDLEEIRSVVEDVLDEKLRPLVKLIAKSREHGVSVTEVVGGVGYIFGIMGIVMYLRNRKR